jgi:hypothetical protein
MGQRPMFLMFPSGQMLLFIKRPWALPKAKLFCAVSALQRIFKAFIPHVIAFISIKIVEEPNN